MTTTEPTPTPLVSLAQTLNAIKADLDQRSLRLDPVYSWEPADVAEMLLDLDEQVFTTSGLHLVTEAVAEKLKAFAEDFILPAEAATTGPKFPGVSVQLTGEDGNAFFIASRVRTALDRAGHKDAAVEFFNEALSGDYDHLLQTAMKYVDVN